MVIQRLQSLLLLIAAVLMGLMFLAPVAVFDDPAVKVTIGDSVALTILDIVIGVLLLVDIFLYKNLRLQMLVASISALLMCGLAGVYCAWITNAAEVFKLQPVFALASLMLLAAFVLTLVARRLMRRDRNLLRSADRLR